METKNKIFTGIIAGLIFILNACSSGGDDPLESVKDLNFSLVMEATPYMGANSINVSPNEKYMVVTYLNGNDYQHYYSTDHGETLERFPNHILGNYRQYVETNISNNGRFVVNNVAYDLNTPDAITNNVLAVTRSGKIIAIQQDPATNKPTFYTYSDEGFASTQTEATLASSYFCGVSGDKLGFFDYNQKTMSEYDASTNTYTEKQVNEIDYYRISGNGLVQTRVKRAYSEGHFLYAKEGGLIIIAPDNSITYYDYPPLYRIYLNTGGRLRLYGNKAYVEVFSGTGKGVFETKNGEMVETSFAFPPTQAGSSLYWQGFIENGNRSHGGIIKTTNNQSTYLNAGLNPQRIGKTFLILDYLYFDDKVYDTRSKTYRSSTIGTIHNTLRTSGKTISYTSKGTYSTTDGINWTLESETQPRPKLTTQAANGKYYGLGISSYLYYLGGTGFSTPQFDQVAYESADGIQWEEIPGSNKTGLGGYGPSAIYSDGTVVYTANINPLGNSIIYTYISNDYGVNYTSHPDGTLPDGFSTTEFQTNDGRYPHNI